MLTVACSLTAKMPGRSIAVLWLISLMLMARPAMAGAIGDTQAGLDAASRGEFGMAIQFYTRAIESGTLSPIALAAVLDDRGISYHRMREDDLAMADYDRSILLNPNDARTYDNRANAYYGRGQLDQALKDYDRSIQIAPSNARAFANRGNAYYGTGQVDRAIQDYDQSLQLNPNNPDVFDNRGNVYFQLGRFSEAEADFRSASDLDPRRAYSAIRLYLALGRQQKDGHAALVALLPNLDIAAWPSPIVRFFLQRNSADDVLAAANADRDNDSRSSHRCEANFYLGEAALLDGYYAEAKHLFEGALDICPKTFFEFNIAKADLNRPNP